MSLDLSAVHRKEQLGAETQEATVISQVGNVDDLS